MQFSNHEQLLIERDDVLIRTIKQLCQLMSETSPLLSARLEPILQEMDQGLGLAREGYAREALMGRGLLATHARRAGRSTFEVESHLPTKALDPISIDWLQRLIGLYVEGQEPDGLHRLRPGFNARAHLIGSFAEVADVLATAQPGFYAGSLLPLTGAAHDDAITLLLEVPNDGRRQLLLYDFTLRSAVVYTLVRIEGDWFRHADAEYVSRMVTELALYDLLIDLSGAPLPQVLSAEQVLLQLKDMLPTKVSTSADMARASFQCANGLVATRRHYVHDDTTSMWTLSVRDDVIGRVSAILPDDMEESSLGLVRPDDSTLKWEALDPYTQDYLLQGLREVAALPSTPVPV